MVDTVAIGGVELGDPEGRHLVEAHPVNVLPNLSSAGGVDAGRRI